MENQWHEELIDPLRVPLIDNHRRTEEPMIYNHIRFASAQSILSNYFVFVPIFCGKLQLVQKKSSLKVRVQQQISQQASHWISFLIVNENQQWAEFGVGAKMTKMPGSASTSVDFYISQHLQQS